MRTVNARGPASGFTLVEFMITVTVLVMLLGMSGPPLAEFLANNQLVAAKSTLASSIALARTEAARLGQPVIVQAVSGGVSGNEFKAGWELYVDADANGSVGSGDTLLRRFDAPAINVKVSGTSPLIFLATGYLSGTATLDYRLCRTSGSTAGYQVSVMPSGVADVRTLSNC